jgi:hypothetical protein
MQVFICPQPIFVVTLTSFERVAGRGTASSTRKALSKGEEKHMMTSEQLRQRCVVEHTWPKKIQTGGRKRNVPTSKASLMTETSPVLKTEPVHLVGATHLDMYMLPNASVAYAKEKVRQEKHVLVLTVWLIVLALTAIFLSVVHHTDNGYAMFLCGASVALVCVGASFFYQNYPSWVASQTRDEWNTMNRRLLQWQVLLDCTRSTAVKKDIAYQQRAATIRSQNKLAAAVCWLARNTVIRNVTICR